MSAQEQTAEKKGQRTVIGRVVSNKMDKTVTVVIERLIRHPSVGKFVRRTGKVMAHDANNECTEGDTVAIRECRPLSKRKSWQVVEIVSSAGDQSVGDSA